MTTRQQRRASAFLGAMFTVTVAGQAAVEGVARMAPVYHAGRIDIISVACATVFLAVGAGTLVGYVWWRVTEWFLDGAR